MSRLGTILSGLIAAALLATLPGCGSSVPPTPGFGVPAVVKLAPSPTASMDIGTSLQFTASALSGSKSPITTTFTYSTSRPAVVSIATNGLACAGTWDSVDLPVVCTPGGAGTAVITASSSGVVSSPVTVYVHEHIDRINVVALPITVGPPPDPVTGCFTASAGSLITATSQTYQAQALADDASGQPTVDITSTVGPFSWGASDAAVAALTPLNTHGIPNGQVEVTAKVPGITQLFAVVTNAESAPQKFETCPVHQITLGVTAGNTTKTSITAVKGNSTSVTPVVTDIAGNLISAPLTWSSSQPAVASVGATGVVTSTNAGGTSVTASCIPPTCNVNLSPMQAIYPVTPIQATYTGTTATPFSVFVSTTSAQCIAKPNCEALMVPITGSPATAGTGAVLPNVPNSMRFDSTGATVFLGTQKGLMRIAASANPPTITNLPTITGKVLAVSPSGTRLIIADTLSPVQQVFIFDATSGVSTHLLINGATAAGFSPDGLKAFIVTPTNLYVHSAQAPLQVGTLASPAVDVSFLANGMFGFVAEGAAGSDYLATCDDPSVSLTSQIIHLPSAAATAIRALPDGSGFLGLAPPDLNLITIPPAGPAPTPGQSGCPSPLGSLTISPTVTPIPLGQGAFTPVAFIVASDGQKVFIVPDSGNIIVYDVLSNVISFLSLTGSPHPLAASLTPDSQLLYVSADDGKVHVINTVAGGDLQQIAVPSSSLCNVTSGGPPPTCLPDLLQVRP